MSSTPSPPSVPLLLLCIVAISGRPVLYLKHLPRIANRRPPHCAILSRLQVSRPTSIKSHATNRHRASCLYMSSTTTYYIVCSTIVPSVSPVQRIP